MEISELKDMIAKGAALRRRQRLQPVGGSGDSYNPCNFCLVTAPARGRAGQQDLPADLSGRRAQRPTPPCV